MFDLVAYIKETYRESNWQQGERNQQQPTEPQILSPQTSTETRISYDPATRILQLNQQIFVHPDIVPLDNITQSSDGRGNIKEINSSANERKINITAALFNLGGFFYSVYQVIYGAIHLKACPAQNMIPVIYIIIGCLWLFLLFIDNSRDYRDILIKVWSTAFHPWVVLTFILQIAYICSFSALCYLTFHINPDNTEDSSSYCEKDFYEFTCFYSTVTLPFIGLGFVLACCGY